MINLDLPVGRSRLSVFLLAVLCAVSVQAQTIQLDNTFGSGGKFTVGFAESGLRTSHAYYVLSQPSGRIVVAGGHINGGQFGTAGIAACGLTSGGALDPGFGTGGKTLEMNDSDFRAIERLSNGQFLRVTSMFLPSLSAAINRINLNGFVDTSFVADLNVGALAVPASVTTRSDGKILVLLRGIGGDDSHWVVRLNSNGSRDITFGANGVVLLNLRRFSRFVVVGLHVLPDNRIMLGGYLQTTPAPSGGNVAWAALLDEHGYYDRRFGLQGIARLPFSVGIRVSKTLLQPDGKIVLIGNARSGATSQFLIARFTSRGRPDPGFGVNGIVIAPNISPGSFEDGYSGALMSDGRIVVVGSHATSQTSGASFVVARFAVAGALESYAVTPFTANQNSLAQDVMIQPDGKLVVAGYTRNPDVTADGNLFAIARYTQ